MPVELPNGFLKKTYLYLGSADGVCVYDEVQTPRCRFIFTMEPVSIGHPMGEVVSA